MYEYDRPDENGSRSRSPTRRIVKDLSGAEQPSDLQPSFTPDRRRIVFIRCGEKADQETIRRVDLPGGDVRLIGGHLGDRIRTPHRTGGSV